MQGSGLGLLVEQGVGELPAVGCLGQRGQEPAAGSGEPAGDRPRPACLAEGSQDGLKLGRDPQGRVGQRGVQLLVHKVTHAGTEKKRPASARIRS